MNKTAILSFIIDEVALKARNVSSNMRKRIHYMLEEKEITVKENDERTLILNGWIRVGNEGVRISGIEEMKKGVSNYKLKTEEQLDRVMTLNNEIRCYRFSFKPTSPIEVESIENLSIDQENYEIYSKCSFNKVKSLELKELSTDQIKLILTRFKRIDKLRIHHSSLKSIDFSQFKIKEFDFADISLEETINLPREIDELGLYKCGPVNLIRAKKVNAINFFGECGDQKESKELIKSLKGVRIARIDESLAECLTSLPSTVREIDIDKPLHEIDNLEGTAKRFPYLIDFKGQVSIEALEKIKLRSICPVMTSTKEEFSFRPRKIRVTSDNSTQLNNHPELFEKVGFVSIESNEFNFDVLSSEIKKIEIWGEVNEESVTLNRFEKECG